MVFFCLDLATFWSQIGHKVWWLKMIDWITAIIPCHHDEKIYGGSVASVNLDEEIEWRVEK